MTKRQLIYLRMTSILSVLVNYIIIYNQQNGIFYEIDSATETTMVTIFNFYGAMDLQGCNYIMGKSHKKQNTVKV